MADTQSFIEVELRFIFLENHTTSFRKEGEVRTRALRSADDPFGQLSAKGDFGKTAKELHDSLYAARKKENSNFIDTILVELYAIGYMLNNNITLKDDRILYYNQQIKQTGKTQYEQLHKTLVEMENETARAISGEEQLKILYERIEIAKANIDKYKDLLQSAEIMKQAGMCVLISGAIGGLFLTALGLLTGNLFVAGTGIATLVASVVTGGGLMIGGQINANKAKEDLKNEEIKLAKLQQQKTELEKAIKEKSTAIIKKLEEDARQFLGVKS